MVIWALFNFLSILFIVGPYSVCCHNDMGGCCFLIWHYVDLESTLFGSWTHRFLLLLQSL
jgi:hypothetical protein